MSPGGSNRTVIDDDDDESAANSYDRDSLSHDHGNSSGSGYVPSLTPEESETSDAYTNEDLNALVIAVLAAHKVEMPKPWQGLDKVEGELRDRLMESDKKEIEGILEHGAAVPIPLEEVPKGTKIIDSLTIRNVKKNGPKKGQAKSRVVLNGSQMKKGEHYEHSHSPGIQNVSLRSLIAVGASLNSRMKSGDFPQAYINADNDRDVYTWPPKSAPQYDDQGRRLVWKVPKALYGGKASGRLWYNLLRTWLKNHEFIQSEWDPCVFVKRDGQDYHFIGVYVDDLVHVYSNEDKYAKLIEQLQSDFIGYTDLGTLSEIFNAEVTQSHSHVLLTQTRYIETIAADHGVETDPTVHTPALNDLLRVVTEAADGTGDVDPHLHRAYRSIVGALLYVALLCRPDIAHTASLLSRCLEHPSEKALAAARRTVQYLVNTKCLGLRWQKGPSTGLHGYSDSDWATVKSTSGYVFFWACAAIAYIAKKQSSIALSSTEAEIMAASLASLEIVFLRGLFKSLGISLDGPTPLGIDNQGAVALAESYVSNSRTKHIERRHLKIRELVESEAVEPQFVPTDANVADIFTKVLPRRRFEKLRRILLNHEMPTA